MHPPGPALDPTEPVMTLNIQHRPVLARRWALGLCFALLVGGGWAVQAQTPPADAAPPPPVQAPVLATSQVTEDALVDALAIEPAPPDESASGATRGFRPALRPSVVPAKPAAPGKANLLITFASGSAELTAETIRVLETVARALQSDRLAGFAFRIEGHADARGSIDLNQKLSQDRAQSVVAYLSGKLGILAERMQPVGKGASEPLNLQKADAVENRRVTIVTTR